MSNSITRYEPTTLDDLQRTAKLLAASGYFDAKGSAEMAIAQIATKIMAGGEMGYGPFASVQGIHVIQGKPALSANLMAAAVKGHPRYDYRVRQMDDTCVTVEFFEDGQSLGISSFSADDAKKAGTQNMQKFPRNMLFARAMSNGVKWFCPDVFNGNTVYTPEDFDIDSESIRVVDESTSENLSPPANGKPVKKQTPKASAGDPQSDAWDAIPGAADEKQEADDLNKARRAFRAEINKHFNGDSDAARHWLIEGFTTKRTPDNVRRSANDLNVAELDSLRKSLSQYAGDMIAKWNTHKAELDAINVAGAEPLAA